MASESTEQQQQPVFADEKASRDDSGSFDLSLDDVPHARQGEDSAMAKRVWRKLDLYLLPVVTMFYFLSFLVSVYSIGPLARVLIPSMLLGPV